MMPVARASPITLTMVLNRSLGDEIKRHHMTVSVKCGQQICGIIYDLKKKRTIGHCYSKAWTWNDACILKKYFPMITYPLKVFKQNINEHIMQLKYCLLMIDLFVFMKMSKKTTLMFVQKQAYFLVSLQYIEFIEMQVIWFTNKYYITSNMVHTVSILVYFSVAFLYNFEEWTKTFPGRHLALWTFPKLV